MRSLKPKRFSIFTQLALSSASWFAVMPAAYSSDSFIGALTSGKPSAYLRYRFESVDQEGFADKARASTLRTQLGYQTGDFHNFGAFVQFEDVRSLGNDRYNSTINGRTQFPVVADPKGTEINQAYLSYKGIPGTTLKYGRQAIIYDNHRFIGNVGFRQNEQTYDAFTIQNTSLPSTTISYAHITNVNRIFGENHPTQSDLHMNSDLLNVAYNGFKAGKIVGYGYFLDYEAGQTLPVTASNKTLGIRFDGSYPLDKVKFLYTVEYATQDNYKSGAASVEADYSYAMLGIDTKGIQLKLNYEVLGGDGVYGFATPLATLHAFNGWADKFLTTPRDGIRDAFVSIGGNVWGTSLLAVYHDYSSDSLDYRYGSEWNLQASKKIEKNLTLTVKYASYNGDANSLNVARNTPASLPRDVEKIWLQAELQF